MLKLRFYKFALFHYPAFMLDLGHVTLWIHTLSLSLYFGCVAIFLFLFLPVVDAIEEKQLKRDLLVRGLRIYNPIQIGSLGVLVMSGAFNLTRYKAEGVSLLLGSFGATLAWKLGLVFILIILSVHQTMAIAHPVVRRHQSDPLTFSDEPVFKKLRMTSYAILFLTVVVVSLGLKLTHR